MTKILLVCYISPKIGLGHLSRLLALAQTLKKDKKIIPEFLIFGDLIKKDELNNFKVHNFSADSNFALTIENLLKSNNFNGIVFDIYSGHNINDLYKLFSQLKQQNICIISIDCLIEYCDVLDLIWIPSFNFDISKYNHCKSILRSGWDTYLIQKRLNHKKWRPGSKILVLTGGSDVLNLGKILPTQLDNILDKNSEVHWVKGPLSNDPKLPEKQKLKWIFHDTPQQLDEIIVQSNYVLTVFGVTFFEVLQYGIPTVVFSPYDKKDDKDLKALSNKDVAVVSNSSRSAIKELSNLMADDKLANKLSINALKKLSINGSQQLSKKIYFLLKGL
jgi:spore coat polysaccharide biosynthesis predicted glycosyltransferase SpsG